MSITIILGACDSSELVYEMTLDEIGKSDLIFFHNYRRATVFPPATNMVMLEWDDELANEASKFVRQNIVKLLEVIRHASRQRSVKCQGANRSPQCSSYESLLHSSYSLKDQ